MIFSIRNIESLCKKITDGSHFSPENEDDGVYPMFSVKDMLYNGFSDKDYKTIGKTVFQKLSKSDCRPLKNDILIAKDGSYLKYVFKAKQDIDACILSSIAILKPDIEQIDPDYFVYLMRSKSIKDAMANYVSGSALPRIILSDFKKMKLKMVEDKVVQKCIASVLSTYDDLIENNNKRIKILEQMAQELYKEWFVRLRFPGYNDIKIEDGLPADWEIKKLSDFGISLDTGSRPTGGIDASLTDGVPSLGAEAINALAEFDYSSVKLVPVDFYNSMKRGRNTGNDILVYKDGAYIGKVTLFRNEFPYKNYAVNEHVFLLKPTNELYLNYLYFTLHQDAYFYLMQNLNRNAAQPGLSREDIKQIKITVPSETTIKRFNDVVEPILNKIFVLAKQNANLAKQRDLLLPRLMSGKLEIKGTDDA